MRFFQKLLLNLIILSLLFVVLYIYYILKNDVRTGIVLAARNDTPTKGPSGRLKLHEGLVYNPAGKEIVLAARNTTPRKRASNPEFKFGPLNKPSHRAIVLAVRNDTSDKGMPENSKLNEGLVYNPTQATVDGDVTSDGRASPAYNVWCIFTKVSSNAPLRDNFQKFVSSLIGHSSLFITLHLIVDKSSKDQAQDILRTVRNITSKRFAVVYYRADELSEELKSVISAMLPYFSSKPGTYYSDALFFLSLGLHRIASEQKYGIMFDADTKLLADVEVLFKEFEKFGPQTLFGLAPELTPVYRHVLYVYRSKNKGTSFGEPLSKNGYPGVNSGVILFHFDRIRRSELYNKLLEPEAVKNLTDKYNFKGHLGDQDFYTLLGMEYPELLHLVPCEWNRQLCTWWKSHGYQDVFDEYFQCDRKVKVYHGNCNTPIPSASSLHVRT